MRTFTPLGFVAHLAELVVALPVAEHEGLEKAAQLIEDEAKAEIGHYQGRKGPFGKWPELAPPTKADRLRKGFTENDPLLRTGDMRDSIHHNVSDHEAYIGSDDKIAVYQELGTRHIPPRSFLGGAAARKEREVAEILANRIVEALLVGRGAHSWEGNRYVDNIPIIKR
jgi:phage gpG-like protein